MPNANTRIYDKTIDRAAMLRLYENRSVGKVELIIDGHAVRVDKLIKDSRLQGRDFNTFLKRLDDEIIGTMADAHNVSSRSLLDLFREQTDYTTKTLDSAVGKIWKTQKPPRRIAEEIVLKQPLYSNMTLDQGWAGIGKNERIRIEGLIRKGIAEGQTSNAIADTIMKDGYKATKNQARGLVVTATTSVLGEKGW